MGSPSVAGSTFRFSSGTSSGSFSATDLGRRRRGELAPSAGRRSRSSSPRLIVERASRDLEPPRARPSRRPHSPAANNRRPRSSRVEPTVFQRYRMAPRRPSDRSTPVNPAWNAANLSHTAARPGARSVLSRFRRKSRLAGKTADPYLPSGSADEGRSARKPVGPQPFSPARELCGSGQQHPRLAPQRVSASPLRSCATASACRGHVAGRAHAARS